MCPRCVPIPVRQVPGRASAPTVEPAAEGEIPRWDEQADNLIVRRESVPVRVRRPPRHRAYNGGGCRPLAGASPFHPMEPVARRALSFPPASLRLFAEIVHPGTARRTCLKVRIDKGLHPGHDRRVWETRDPDGRRVILTWPRWAHVVHKHPDLAVAKEVILGIVATPDERLPGRRPGAERFYRRGAGPSAWIRWCLRRSAMQRPMMTGSYFASRRA